MVVAAVGFVLERLRRWVLNSLSSSSQGLRWTTKQRMEVGKR
jgi:hypothetical protein